MASGNTANILGPNVGKDISITITDSLGNTYVQDALGILTNVDPKFKYKHHETESLTQGGRSWNISIPKGGTIKIKFKRYNAGVTKLLLNYNSNWRSGTVIDYTIQMQIQNRDGTIDSFQGQHCVPTEGDGGMFSPDTDVPQEIGFECSDIVQV